MRFGKLTSFALALATFFAPVALFAREAKGSLRLPSPIAVEFDGAEPDMDALGFNLNELFSDPDIHVWERRSDTDFWNRESIYFFRSDGREFKLSLISFGHRYADEGEAKKNCEEDRRKARAKLLKEHPYLMSFSWVGPDGEQVSGYSDWLVRERGTSWVPIGRKVRLSCSGRMLSLVYES